jgi:hypothetical protein
MICARIPPVAPTEKGIHARNFCVCPAAMGDVSPTVASTTLLANNWSAVLIKAVRIPTLIIDKFYND